MKKFILGLCAGLLLAPLAHASVIGFDELNANGKLASISPYNPYDNLTWSATWYLGVTSVTGYSNGAHSGSQFLSNGRGVNNLGVSSSTAFDFEGAWFATPLTNGGHASWINITAYDLSNHLIGSTGNITISPTYSWIGANFSNVGRLDISHDTGLSWFVMDDFSIKDPVKVPEPGSAALLMLGFAALGFSRRKTAR